MRIRNFEARSMREAIAQVKRELGPEAVILSARPTHKGLFATPMVEVTAGVDVEALDSKASGTAPSNGRGPASGRGPAGGRGGAASPLLDELDVDRIVAPLKAEMRSLRSLVRQQAEGNPELAAIKAAICALERQTIAQGTNPGLLQGGQAHLQGGQAPLVGQSPTSLPVAAHAAIDKVADKMAAAPITAEMRARVIVVVGSPGVGKTTTIAKLASRDALVAGKEVVLVTSDAYRVGGVEQIRAYAELIGVPLETVGEPEELDFCIPRLTGAERIYVDTGGRSRLDLGELGVLAEAIARVPDVEVHLAISACSSAHQVDQEVKRYRFFGPSRIIFTKVDEADDLRELVLAPARTELPVSFITMGQRVPEDIEIADPRRLVELAKRGQWQKAVAA